MKKKITFLLMFVLSLSMVSAQGTFRFGTSATPEGKTLLVDSKGLILDGKHIIPVMGEIHYSRVPESEWRREIRKMKAGGINIISTYIFWIHHEPEEGKWNWSGSAGSRTSGRFVAARIRIPLELSNPSISARSWFNVCSRSSLLL